MAVCTFLLTLSFLFSTPPVLQQGLGFPFYLLRQDSSVKRYCAFGAAVWSLAESLKTMGLRNGRCSPEKLIRIAFVMQKRLVPTDREAKLRAISHMHKAYQHLRQRFSLYLSQRNWNQMQPWDSQKAFSEEPGQSNSAVVP